MKMNKNHYIPTQTEPPICEKASSNRPLRWLAPSGIINCDSGSCNRTESAMGTVKAGCNFYAVKQIKQTSLHLHTQHALTPNCQKSPNQVPMLLTTIGIRTIKSTQGYKHTLANQCTPITTNQHFQKNTVWLLSSLYFHYINALEHYLSTHYIYPNKLLPNKTFRVKGWQSTHPQGWSPVYFAQTTSHKWTATVICMCNYQLAYN